MIGVGIPWILWMLGAALIGGFIGWIIRGNRSVDNTYELQYNSLLDEHNDVKSNIGRYKSDADKYKGDYNSLQGRLKNMVEKSQLVEVENRWKSANSDLDRQKTEVKNLEVEIADLKRKMNGMVTPAVHSDVESALATFKAENTACGEKLVTVQGELDAIKNDSVARSEFNELSLRFNSLKSKYDDASSKLASFEGDGDQYDMRDRMTGLRNEILSLKAENEKLKAGAPASADASGSGSDSEWEAKYNALKADADAAQSKVKELESAASAAPASSGSGDGDAIAKLQAKNEELKRKNDNTAKKVAELTASLSNANIAANSGVPQSKYDELEEKYNALKERRNFENTAPAAAPVEPPVLEEESDDAGSSASASAGTALGAMAAAPAASTSDAGDNASGTESSRESGGLKADKDDLTKIEGIGPKTREVLHAAGINTFCELAAKSPEEIKAILDASDGNFDLSDTTTWPQQASLACDGKWDELKKWQDELDGGRPADSAPAEKKVLSAEEKQVAAKDLVSKLGEGTKETADDLKKISGVGPKMEATLNQIGIFRFSQVAKMTKAEYDVLDSITGSFPGRAERDDWAGQAAKLAVA